jgi:hypothetical protein
MLTTPYVSEILPQNLSTFEIALSCSGSTNDPCYLANAHPLEVRGVELTLDEDVPPVIGLQGGTLTTGGTQSGARSVSYTGRDEESGVAKVEGLLGDTVVGTQDFSGDCSYTDFNACPKWRNNDLTLNTRAVPNGSYVFRLRITDAAGNRTVAQAPNLVKVKNGSLPSVNRLTARFVGTGRATATRAYGRPVTIKGRLTDAHGGGMPHRVISVLERREATGQVMRARNVTTGAGGGFVYRVTSRGPSRVIDCQFRMRIANVDDVATRKLVLRVKAASSLRVSLHGVNVRYEGVVVSHPIPPRGKRVLLQGRVRGGPWQTFAFRRTSKRGRFSGRYRLRVYRPGIRLQFRVRVPAEAGYPYAAGSGRVLTRQVR